MAVSKSQVDRAGGLIRAAWIGSPPPTSTVEDLTAAIRVIWAYRSQFTYPTTKVASNLRYYVQKAKVEVVVAQRWKRLPRIIEKLERHPKMRLSQKQDVGGCRAVLPSQEVVDKVLAGIKKNWDIVTVDDYVSAPRATGYRAIHAIVQKDNLPVEVQLRTYGQQDWADEVERIDGLIPEALKDGEGPADIIRYTKRLAEVIDAQETGNPVDRQAILELTELARSVP